MMKTRILLLAGFSLTACSDAPHERLLGTWKSNAQLTLATIDNASYLTPEGRAVLEDDVFGHLFVEYEDDKFITYWDNTDYAPIVSDYVVLEVSGDLYLIGEPTEDGGYHETAINFDGECFWVDISDGEGFVEYFCRTPAGP